MARSRTDVGESVLDIRRRFFREWANASGRTTRSAHDARCGERNERRGSVYDRVRREFGGLFHDFGRPLPIVGYVFFTFTFIKSIAYSFQNSYLNTHTHTAETLISGNTELVEHVYEKFAALPPRLRKSSLRATAACAEAGLLHTREEYEMMNAVLSEVVESGEADEGAIMEYEKNNAMLKAMDDMLEAMLKNVSDW